jgi:hypothetical protein
MQENQRNKNLPARLKQELGSSEVPKQHLQYSSCPILHTLQRQLDTHLSYLQLRIPETQEFARFISTEA